MKRILFAVSYMIPAIIFASQEQFTRLKILHVGLQNCKEELAIAEQLIRKKDFNVSSVYVDGWVRLFDKQLPEFEQQLESLGDVQALMDDISRQWQLDETLRLHSEIIKNVNFLQEYKPKFDEFVQGVRSQVHQKRLQKVSK